MINLDVLWYPRIFCVKVGFDTIRNTIGLDMVRLIWIFQGQFFGYDRVAIVEYWSLQLCLF